MSRVEAQPAFVLHDRPYRESSVLLEVLSRDHGRIGIVARGVRSERPRLARGLLKPLVALEIGWSGRGELGTLTRAEPLGAPLVVHGEALVCALYVNELVARLLPRNDPHPGLFARYAGCLLELAQPQAELDWVLRRFERDVLAELGYALELAREAEHGAVLVAEASYSYDPERGPVPWHLRPLAPAVSGAALAALAADAVPVAPIRRELRRVMRALLLHHLGGRELEAWRMFAAPRADA
jgi:DNA repair protein RecO (recombination protein O)